MNRDHIHFLFLNVAHFLDHMFMLIFATVAALAMSRGWGLSYGDLLKYATPGFFALACARYRLAGSRTSGAVRAWWPCSLLASD